MATKRQIAEQAMRILAGGPLKPDRTLDIREVMMGLDQLRDRLVVAITNENFKNGDYYVDEDFLSFYESVQVNIDLGKDLRFSVIPANILSLPNRLGLYQITPINDMENVFIIMKAGEQGILSGTQALEHELNTYCWPVNDRVYYKNLDPALTEVTMILAVSSAEIDSDAEFPITPDAEATLIEQLVQLYGIHTQQPHDEVEDGNK